LGIPESTYSSESHIANSTTFFRDVYRYRHRIVQTSDPYMLNEISFENSELKMSNEKEKH